MQRLLVAVLSVCSVVSLSGRALAQVQNGLPSVTIMHAGVDQLEKDLQFLLKEAGPQAAAQLPLIEGIIPAFIGGIDKTRAITVDIILGNPRDYRISLPIANLTALLKNIEGFAGAKAVRTGRNEYVFRKGKAFDGTAIVIDTNGDKKPDYMVLANDAKNIPKGFTPIPAITRLKKYHLAALVTNTAAGAAARKAAIDDIRDELNAATTRMPNETDDQFKLREMAQVHRMDELERLFVDAEELVLGWSTDYAIKEGRLDLELSALPDTQLAKDIAEVGNDLSLFSSVVRAEDATVFGRMNQTLDKMRQGNITQFLTLIEKQVITRIIDSKKIKDANRESATNALQKFIAMLQNGNTEVGRIDGILEITEGKNGRTLVGGIRAHCGTTAEDVLSALKAAGWEVQLNTEEATQDPVTVGDPPASSPPAGATGSEADEPKPSAPKPDEPKTDEPKPDQPKPDEPKTDDGDEDAEKPCPGPDAIRFHEVKIPATDEFNFPAVFGTDTMLIAAGKEVVYYGIGKDAKAAIRKLIDATGEDPEKEDGTFFEVWYRVGPWITWGKERAARLGPDPKLTEEEKKAQADRKALGERALAVFEAGLDSIYTKLQVKQEKDRRIVVGFTTFKKGLLAFVGSEFAKAAKDNLQ